MSEATEYREVPDEEIVRSPMSVLLFWPLYEVDFQLWLERDWPGLLANGLASLEDN
jgi:hypothetical protein